MDGSLFSEFGYVCRGPLATSYELGLRQAGLYCWESSSCLLNESGITLNLAIKKGNSLLIEGEGSN